MKEGVKARACLWLVPFSSQLHPHLQYKGFFKERSFPFWVFNATRKTLLSFELGTPGMCPPQRLERLRRMSTSRWTYSPVFFITQQLRLPRFTPCPQTLLPANCWKLLVPLDCASCQAWYKYRLSIVSVS